MCMRPGPEPTTLSDTLSEEREGAGWRLVAGDCQISKCCHLSKFPALPTKLLAGRAGEPAAHLTSTGRLTTNGSSCFEQKCSNPTTASGGRRHFDPSRKVSRHVRRILRRVRWRRTYVGVCATCSWRHSRRIERPTDNSASRSRPKATQSGEDCDGSPGEYQGRPLGGKPTSLVTPVSGIALVARYDVWSLQNFFPALDNSTRRRHPSRLVTATSCCLPTSPHQ
ncbi:hypothetical protein OBBRIDRAFT_485839 [Obba rivulosa]|uniref:Uncharacterized protein n=1 Tax=Obba rivulosa TaxID=1052685 RepID=A0A8E2AX96_9APHY|nr:hypothetical protein OBBRIDRAFT_485839 [Obba rivulosa]